MKLLPSVLRIWPPEFVGYNQHVVVVLDGALWRPHVLRSTLRALSLEVGEQKLRRDTRVGLAARYVSFKFTTDF